MHECFLKKLDFKIQPVGISFSQEKPENALEFNPSKRVCIVSMLLSATKGRTVAVSERTCVCPGGAVGVCFGDAFTERNHKTAELLSTGVESSGEGEIPKHIQYGERFFKSPDLAQLWKDSMPYIKAPEEYVIFEPLYKANPANPPKLALLFVNPDQLSALVVMSGYLRGNRLNVIAPFVAACQSILLSYHEIEKAYPKAILGGFDIAQRHRFPKEILTLTMPYKMFTEIEGAHEEGCMTTEAWEKIEDRWSEGS